MSANQGIADRLTVDADLVAERDRKIGEHLARRPPWWRIWARRRWKRELAALQSLNVSFMAAMFRQLYTPETVENLAKRSGPAARLSRMVKARTARKNDATREAADQLAAWTDAQNGVPVYYPERMRGRGDVD